MNPNKLLIIDDDTTFCNILQRSLTRHGLEVDTCNSAACAIAATEQFQPEWVILDLRLDNESGLQLIEPLLKSVPTAKILVLTGFASLATAVQAIKLGAIDYLSKPVEADAILTALGLSDAPENRDTDISVPTEPVSLKRLEWEQIQRVLKENDGNITNTAKQLGMYRRTLQRKLQKKPSKW